jgi:hypothetical protein
VGSILFNTTHFARFDFRRFETVYKACCVRKVSSKVGFSADVKAPAVEQSETGPY